MSTLNDNLLQIYNTKLEIKDAIGTNSDVFEDYPSYIRNLRGLTWEDVINSGYTYTNGTYVVGLNGNYDISTYNNIWVNVPTGGGSVSGTYTITNNGLYNISSYEYVNVDVEPNLLVNAWSGYSVDASSNNVVYVMIDNLLNEPLLSNRQCSIDTIDSLLDAEYGPNTNSAWYPSDSTVNIVIDEDASAGGEEAQFGWLKITFSNDYTKNGFIRVKFTGTASNTWHDYAQFDSNWITFEFYRGA